MGHYSDLRDFEREERDLQSRGRLLEIVEEASSEDRDFLIYVFENIEDIKAHFRVIGKKL